jgi:hypothetical protein
MTRAEARKRFVKHSGAAYQQAEYRVDKDAREVGGADRRERAKFWEIWSKTDGRVYWVSPGCDLILDEGDPHLEFRQFFPCPQPAYGTVQRGSLVPVPDVLQYRDQLEELNLLTGRIHALSDALEAKGFYPAGGAELADAVQAAVQNKTPGRMLVPISNWAAFGGSKEIIVWLPIDMIAQTIIHLVTLRKQVIEDIYQIMGISDIMRGSTDPNETLGAQQLKTQNSSTRIRDKQMELVRMARDIVEISIEIICQVFDPVTIIEMSQTQLPTQAMQRQEIEAIINQVRQLHGQMQQLQSQPQLPAPGMNPSTPSGGPGGTSPGAPPSSSPSPEQGAQQVQAIQGQIQQLIKQAEKIKAKPTIEQVLHFLEDNRARSFTLDIETDSTILADENAEKKARTEFMGVLGGVLTQLTQLVAAEPKASTFAGEILKFATAPFRAGRSLEGSIDEFIEQMKEKADGPQPENPEQTKQKLTLQIEQLKQSFEREKLEANNKLEAAKMAQADKHKTWELNNQKEIERMKMVQSQQQDAAKAQQLNQKAMADREKHQADMIGKQQDVALGREKFQIQKQQSNLRNQDMAQRANERHMAHQQKMMQPARPTL